MLRFDFHHGTRRCIDRFYRADSALAAGDGTGLGLAIVQSIMQLQGGTVSLDSELGCGTAVTLKFLT